MNTASAKVGDKVRTKGASDVMDGVWEVVEALPKPKGNMSNGGYVARLRVMARRRQTPDWEPSPWWVEDMSVTEILPSEER